MDGKLEDFNAADIASSNACARPPGSQEHNISGLPSAEVPVPQRCDPEPDVQPEYDEEPNPLEWLQRHRQQKEARQAETRGAEVRREDLRRGDVRQGDVQRGDVQRGDVQRGDVQQGDVQQGDVKQEDVEQGDVEQEDVKQEEAEQEEVNHGEVMQEEMKQEEVKLEGVEVKQEERQEVNALQPETQRPEFVWLVRERWTSKKPNEDPDHYWGHRTDRAFDNQAAAEAWAESFVRKLERLTRLKSKEELNNADEGEHDFAQEYVDSYDHTAPISPNGKVSKGWTVLWKYETVVTVEKLRLLSGREMNEEMRKVDLAISELDIAQPDSQG